MTHIEILRFFNKWRRGDAQSGALDAAGITPQMIGQAIDACLADAERYRWLRDKCHLFEHYRAMKWRQDAFEKEVDAAMSQEAKA